MLELSIFDIRRTAQAETEKDDKKILMDNRWVHVTDEELKAQNPIYDTTISTEIRGHDEELYGYLIYAAGDRVQVKIIDEQTVRLNYRYNRNYRQ